MFKKASKGTSKNTGGHCGSLTASSMSPPSKQQQQQNQQQHAQQPHSIAWQDYLPPGLAPASPSSPLPLFSPSQQSLEEQDNVLHSIFSPTFLFQQARRQGQKRHIPAGEQQRHHHHVINRSSSKAYTGTTTQTTATSTTTPQNHQHNTSKNNNHDERRQKQQCPTTPASIPRSLYMTTTANENDLPCSPLEMSYYSPAQQQTTTSSGLLGWRHAASGDDGDDNDFYSIITESIAAAESTASVSSWKTYSLEHITTCQNASELQQIIQQLQTETKTTPCPSLLRAALERLKTVSNTNKKPTTSSLTVPTATHIMSPPPPPQENEPSLDARKQNRHDSAQQGGLVVVHNTVNSPSAQTATSSSLVYSDDGSQQFPLLEKQQQQVGTASSSGRGRDHSNKNNKHNHKKHVSSTTSTIGEQHELQAQVGRLKDAIVELDQRHAQEQESFLKRLQDLRLAESRAGEKIQQLQKDLSSSRLSNEKLLESLEEMQEDVKTLRLQYQAEQTARIKQAQKYKQVEARLTTRIQQLVQELDEQQKALVAAAAAAATTTTKKEDPILQQKLAQLNIEVRSMKRQLESVRKERNAMLRAMIDATGQNVNNIKQMTGHDRRCLIADFAKRSAACKSAFDAMTKALTLSEMERRQSFDCQRKMEGQIKGMINANARLEEHSFHQIQQLTKELATTRAHVDELLHSAHAQQQVEYQEREVLYQKTIRRLKKQICSQEGGSMVPARDYKSAVAEATRLSRTVAHLEQEILHQQEYYYHQQQKLVQQQRSRQQQQEMMGRVDSQCSNSSKENRQPLRTVIVGDITATENIAPNKTIDSNSNNAKQVFNKIPPPPPPRGGETKSKDDGTELFLSPTSSKPKSKRRQEVVRQHGGRKGLQERIQAVRGSPPCVVATTITAVATVNKREGKEN